MKRLRLPSLRKVGILMWSRAFMYVRKAGTFILGASIILWFLNTYPRPEEDTAPTNAAAMEHSYAGQIGHWMEPVTQVAGFDWKINSALVGAFAAKEIFRHPDGYPLCGGRRKSGPGGPADIERPS